MSAGSMVGPPFPDRRMVWVYAGFWWRVLAALLDFVILSAADLLLRFLVGLVFPRLGTHVAIPSDSDASVSRVADFTLVQTIPRTQMPHWHMLGGVVGILSLLVPILYFVLLESSRWQATIGKRVCRIVVTDLRGERIGVGRAIGRYFGKYVSLLIFMIGFLMVGWTRRKQGLHDMMAGTLVMRLRESDPVFTFREPGR